LKLQRHRAATEFKFYTPNIILNDFLTPTRNNQGFQRAEWPCSNSVCKLPPLWRGCETGSFVSRKCHRPGMCREWST